MKKTFKSKSGYSLVEMVLVIAILSIMTGVIALTVNLVNSTSVNKAADRFMHGMKEAKTLSMTKGSKAGTLFVHHGSTGLCYYTIGSAVSTDRVQLFSGKVGVRILYDDGSEAMGENFRSSYDISFDQATGSIRAHSETDDTTGNVTEKMIDTVEFYEVNGKKKVVIDVQPITGTCSIID